MKKYDLSIDLIKGLAIILVYMGHSVLYYPPHLFDNCEWSKYLMGMIISCNMPLFFIVSGLLFGWSRKSNFEVAKDKLRRLLIPWLFAMTIAILAKIFLPSSMAAYPLSDFKSFLYYLFVTGGDRWFVYVLLIIYILILPIRKISTTWWVFIIMFLFFGITLSGALIDYRVPFRVIWYTPFFLLGMFLSQYYIKLRQVGIKHAWMVAIVFGLSNVLFVRDLSKLGAFSFIILPITGILFFMFLSFWVDGCCQKINKKLALVKYIAYCGHYSLQFYLFSFAYPIIRYLVVNVAHMENPLAIFFTVLISQLIIMTIIVELTKNIKFLRIPMGY